MSDLLAGRPILQPEEDADLEVAPMFAEMERLNARMRADDAAIARLKQEADAYKREAEHWKADSAPQRAEAQHLRLKRQAIAQETRLALDRLKAP